MGIIYNLIKMSKSIQDPNNVADGIPVDGHEVAT